MPKNLPKIPEKLRVWIDARKRHALSHAHIQMARELSMNPKSLGKLDNHRQEPWKAPLPEFIESLYLERFGKSKPDSVLTIEQRAQQLVAKKEERHTAKLHPKAVASRPNSYNKILFLCTWNYYRSRFAEIYFNWEASAAKLNWRADSRGLALPKSTPNTISGYTVNYLNGLCIPFDPVRTPIDATESDFEDSQRIIAVKRDEHLPWIQQRFDRFADRVEYWDIHDVDASTPEEQLPLLRAKVRQLVTELVGF